MNCSRFYIVLFLFISTLSVFGQKKFRFNNFNERDGLPSVMVNNILKDSLGVMWFGSANGLFSYDGYEFKTSWNNKKMSGEFTYIIKNGINRIWTYNYNMQSNSLSLEYIDLTTNNIEKIKLPDHMINIEGENEKYSINDIYQINSDQLLFITNNYLYRYNLHLNTIDSIGLKGQLKNDFTSSNDFKFTDTENSKMIFYKKGFVSFDEDLKVFDYFKFSSKDSSEYLIDFKRHNKDTLLVLSNNSNFYFFIENSGVFEYWLNCDANYRLTTPKSFVKTKKNELIIQDGRRVEIFKIDNNFDTLFPYYQNGTFSYNTSIQKDQLFYDMYYDNNILWLSSMMYGIYTLNFKDQKINTINLKKLKEQDLRQEKSIDNYNIHNVTEYNNSFFATSNYGILKFDPSFKILRSIQPNHEKLYGNGEVYVRKDYQGGSFLISKNNKLWCAHQKIGKFNEHTNEIDLFENSKGIYRAIIEQNNDIIWLSDMINGLTKFNNKTQEFTNYKYGESGFPCMANLVSDFALKDSILYMGTATVGVATLNTNNMSFSSFGKEHSPTILGLDIVNDSIWVSTWNNGILCFDIHSGKLLDSYTIEDGLPTNATSMIKIDKVGNLWATSNHGLIYIHTKNRHIQLFNEEDGIIEQNLLRGDKFINENNKGELMMGYGTHIYTWDPVDFHVDTTMPNIYFNCINYVKGEEEEKIYLLKTPYENLKYNHSLNYDQNNIKFEFSAIHFLSERNIEYAYRLNGLENEWNYSKERSIEYSRLAPGTYTFEVKAANSDGVWCKPISFTFTITPPFWITWWFISICIGLLLLSIYLLIRIRTKQLKSRQLQLQQTVKERTKELASKHEESENNRLLAEEKNKEIIDSINYAKRLQDSILPYEANINQLFPEAFILFRPKDIVSGDFYWFKQLKDRAIIAAVDCTGHGVPGAFMSFIGANGLNAATDEKQLSDTSEILNHLNESVHKALNKENNQGYIRDGMDLTICSFDLKKLSLQFSGAKNSIYQIRNEELIQHSGDDFAIGSFSPRTKNYKSQNITLEKGDTIYLFSDGYPDQFGGIKGKKFMYKQFKQKLIEFSNLSMKDQKIKLEQTMDAWMSSHEQIDDILVIGIKI